MVPARLLLVRHPETDWNAADHVLLEAARDGGRILKPRGLSARPEEHGFA